MRSRNFLCWPRYALGAEDLAELLIELGTGNPDVKGRIRLEVASAQSPDEVATEIRKWLATIAGSTLTHRRTEACLKATFIQGILGGHA